MKAKEWLELPPPETPEDSRAECLDAFARAVMGGGEVPVPGQQGRGSLDIIRGTNISMQRGKPVDFPVQE